MRALVLSDLHFGAWTGEDLLRHPAALDALAPALADVDEVVLLGDLFDWLFGTVADAVAASEGLLARLRPALAGRRVVFVAGNHDHHAVVRDLRDMVELHAIHGDDRAAADADADAEDRSFVARLLRARLPETEVVMSYPTYRVGDVLCTHGHYLDAHVRGSLPERLLARGEWSIAGGRPSGDLRIADYEAALVPLTELLFTVAQLPRGTHAQMTIQKRMEHLGHALAIAGEPVRELRRFAERLPELVRHRPDAAERGAARRAGETRMVRSTESDESPDRALAAFGQVVACLDWHDGASAIVFGHTHQPLAAARVERVPDVRFWNTGSWIYEPPSGSRDAWARYLEHAWPGTAVLIDTDRREPELIELLAGRNPLRAGRGALPWPPPPSLAALLDE